MDGKIFSFDLQRFDVNVWSLPSAGAESLVYGAGESFIASLTTSGSDTWSLSTSGTSTTVSIDATAGNNNETFSLVSSSINEATARTIFDASSVTFPFYFKFASSTPITSITGGSGGASIDASALNKSGTFHLDGGTGSDSLVAGSNKSDTFYLNGGSSGADTLVGGNGIDYFIFDGGSDHTASIQSYTAGQDFISLTSALPGATSVKAVNDNDLALYFGTGGANSLLVENVKDSAVTVIKDGAKYYYSKDWIANSDYTSVSLTSNGSDTFTALGSNFSTKAVTIDARAVSVDGSGGVNVTLNNKGDYFIGSTLGNSVYGGTGNDKISLGAGNNIFYYKGGADSILGYGTGTDSIKLNASKLSLVKDGNNLESINGSPGNFKLTFSTGNTLTFTDVADGKAVSIYGYGDTATIPYEYTSTAISINGGEGQKSKVTLGSSFNETKFDGSSTFSVISAAAVGASLPDGSTGFSIKGGASASDIYGSDNVFTSITGGTANDTLQAGKGNGTIGAYLYGGSSGADLLIGGSSKDTFYYTAGNTSIKSYTYGTDLVSLSGTGLTVPMSSFGDSINYGGSDYIVSLGGSNALTFKATQQFALAQGSSLYTYAPGSVALQYAEGNKTIQGITIGGSYYKSKSFNGASEANADYVSIDASAVDHKITVRGNDNANYLVASSLGGGTLLGGLKQDTLVAGSVGAYMDGQDGNVLYIGGAGNDTFVYSGNAASIQNYGAGDIVNFTASDITINAASVSAESVGNAHDHIDLTLNFDDSNKIIFQSLTGAQATSGVSLKSGSSNLYVYKKDSVTWNDKSITLTADYAGMKIGDSDTATSIYTAADNSLTTIDAHLVGKNIGDAPFSIAGNAYGNYIIGSESKANSISGGAGDDTIIGNTVTGKGDVFHYTAGNDVILGFDGKDKFSIGGSYSTDSIAKAKAGRNKLTFTIDKENSIAFRSYESTDAPARISLDGAGGGFLTKDGVVSSITSSADGKYSLKLFGSAKGTIDLNDTLYSDTTIMSVNAAAASKQGLTIAAKSVAGGANYNFYPTNNKRDTFVYDAGAVSITGFESGKDRLNIVDDTITSFSISGGTNGTGGTVIISLNGGDGSTSDIISLSGAQGNEILVRQNGARGYSKMVFRDSGVLENKAKNPTSVTLATGAASYSAVDNTVKKITVTDINNAVSIYAGAKGSIVDASGANKGVSLIGGAKVDKFTGSSGNTDTFFYNTSNGGKDIFNSFVAVGDGNTADSIEFSDGGASLLSSAKISASNKAVKFKFGTKNVLTLKGDNLKDAKLQIDGTKYTYGKNSIAEGSNVSLTSKFGGTYKVAGDVNYVDGSLSEKNLMFKATSANTDETLKGGTKKTTFKGNGGTDSLIGGSGDDIFFYAKGDNGTAHIANFDFKNDKLKIASGTLRKIETIDSGGISFNMSTKNDKDDPVIGYFNIESSYDKSSGETTALDTNKSKKTLIHANNKYYWFAQEEFTETVTIGGESSTITIAAGGLIGYSDKNISSSQAKDYAVIELNYGTNLVKSGVATLVSSKNDKATLPSAT